MPFFRAAPPASIIVVDDNRTALSVMFRRLTRMGYEVAAYESARAALDILQARRFDLMVLDMAMPGMSGMACLTELRESQPTADLPVLMMTERSDPGAAVAALGAGADDHVVKPFDFDVLGARIARLLDRARNVSELKRANEELDARIARRAVEIGELRTELAAARLALAGLPETALSA